MHRARGWIRPYSTLGRSLAPIIVSLTPSHGSPTGFQGLLSQCTLAVGTLSISYISADSCTCIESMVVIDKSSGS